MMTRLINLFKDEDGVTALEYGLIAALIAGAIIAAIGTLSGGITQIFTTMGNKMNSVAEAIPGS